MKIDGHPFPANMVDVGGKRNALQTKVLTSQSAKESGAVDPKAQITADEAKGKEPQQKEESAAPKKKVTSWMLLNKFQSDQEMTVQRGSRATSRGTLEMSFLCVLLGGEFDSADSG
jgi:hypothetical protein